MKNLNDVLIELAKKLTPGLAFSALMFWLVANYGDRIPSEFESVPNILIIGGFLVYLSVTIYQTRTKMLSKDSPIADIEADIQKNILVSGDVDQITQITNNYTQANPGTDNDALQSQIRGYLAWVEENFGKITLRGIEQSGRQVVELPLDSVYVPLQAEYSLEDLQIAEEDDASHLSHINSQMMKQGHVWSREITLNQIFEIGPRLIITGGPGCGKTTVLQHIAWTLAYAIHNEKIDLAKKNLGLEPMLPLPIYVPLSLYAGYRREKIAENAPGRKKTLAAFIGDYLLQNQSNLELDSDFFADLLQSGKGVLLLLDGLDEVPDEAERVIIRQDIENLVSGKKNLRIVVTSRTAAYRGRAVLGREFQHVRVIAIDGDQIQSMVIQAYQAIYPNTPSQAQRKAEDLLSGIQRLEAERNERLGEDVQPLVFTPLMVRMLLIVHFNNRRLPDQRADLYQKAVDAMLRPDYTLDATVSEEIERRVGGSLPMNREMLQLVAFTMHKRGSKQGREIDEDALRAILCSDPTYIPSVDDLIAQTCQRGTLLEERGGQYRFIHLSFQEFLTGRYLVERLRDLEKIAEFLEAGPLLEDWWREPILLMVGYLDITSPRLAREMLIRLAGLDEDAGAKCAGLSLELQLAGAELAVSAYLECQNQAKALQASFKDRLDFFLKAETQKKAEFSPSIFASAADSFDQISAIPSYLFRFENICISETCFHMGRYPVTNVQYQRFIRAKDFSAREYWVGFPKFGDLESKCILMGNWGAEGWKWLQRNWNEEQKLYPRYWSDPGFGSIRKCAPVVGITWIEANAYCRWLLAHWDDQPERDENPEMEPQLIRLPVEIEWIAAAGGERPRHRFPWDKQGEVTRAESETLRRANVMESGINRTTPVWLYPLGASSHGVWDLSGNVWEWQANFHNASRKLLALRGGSFLFNQGFARLSGRRSGQPIDLWKSSGFRVVVITSRS